MTPTTVPNGFRNLTPYLLVPDVDQMLKFYQEVFHATTTERTEAPRGIHSSLRIGDSMLMMGGPVEGSPSQMHLYIDEIKESLEEVIGRAIDAGATEQWRIMTAEYGERFGVIKDPGGISWIVAERGTSKIVHPEMGSVTPYLLPEGASAFIDFLKAAFDAEEIEKHTIPDRGIAHAKIWIGSSILELGEANPLHLKTPTMFYLYVGDVEAAYGAGLAAGAESIQEPAKAHYGDFTAAFKDQFGNSWYVAEHRPHN